MDIKKYTLARYNGIGEKPLVILINHPTIQGVKFDTVDMLKKTVGDDQIYSVYDKNDFPIHGIDNWGTLQSVNWEKLEQIANQ